MLLARSQTPLHRQSWLLQPRSVHGLVRMCSWRSEGALTIRYIHIESPQGETSADMRRLTLDVVGTRFELGNQSSVSC